MSQVRILVISQYYKPEPIKLDEVLKRLVANGHEVSVITSVPNYPAGKTYKKYLFFKSYSTQLDRVQVYRVPTIPRKRNTLFLTLNYLVFALNASVKVLFLGGKFDVVFVYQLSPVTMILPGVVAKKFLGIPLYIYSLDLWPESIKVKSINEKSLFFRMVKKLSTYLYSNSDRISVSSKSFIKYFVEYHGIPKEKINYNPQFAKPIHTNMCLKESINKKLNIFYFGNIGLAQDFDTLIEVMIQLNVDCTFNFVGSGSYLETLKSKVYANQLESRFVFHGLKKVEELNDYYNCADVCFLSLKSNDLTGKTLPNKLLEYMAMAKPIIAVLDGDASDAILEAKCGLVSHPGDTHQLLTNIKTMYNNPSIRNQFGINGFQYYKKHFTLEAHVNALELQLQDIVGGNHV